MKVKVYIIVVAVWIQLLCLTPQALAYTLLYKTDKVEEITPHLKLTTSRLLTAEGNVHAFVLEADLSDVDVAPSYSNQGLSVLADTLSLAKQDGALASINADFFNYGKAGQGSPIGIFMKDGTLLSSAAGSTGYATFMSMLDGTPLIDYVTCDIIITAPNGKTTTVKHYNKFDPLDGIVIYDGSFTKQTRDTKSTLNLCEFIVEDGVVTDIREGASPVDIPEGAYVIAFLKDHNMFIHDNFKVGDPIAFDVKPSVALSEAYHAVGAGTMLLTQGMLAAKTHGDNARNPRTAIGYNMDKTKLYCVVVDGRGASIGMTLSELAYYCASLGMYDAVNLDGGGSSTMAVKRPLGGYATVNKPSDGSLRKVTNAISLLSKTPEHINVQFVGTPDAVCLGTGVYPYAAVYTDAGDVIDADGQVEFGFSTEDGYVGGTYDDAGYFIPEKSGVALLTARYGEHAATKQVRVIGTVSSIVFANKKMALPDQLSFQLMAKDGDGYTAMLPHRFVTFAYDDAVVRIDGNTMYKVKDGVSLIKAAFGDVAAYAYVSGNGAFDGLTLPADAYQRDPLMRSTQGASVTIDVFGALTLPNGNGEDKYKDVRERMIRAVNGAGTNRIVVGNVDKSVKDGITAITNDTAVQAIESADTTVVYADNADGTLTGGGGYNWTRVRDNLAYASTSRVLVVLSRDVYNGGMNANEREVFLTMLSEATRNGKQVTVVYPSASNGIRRVDGVRLCGIQGTTGISAEALLTNREYTRFLRIGYDDSGLCYEYIYAE